MPASERKNTIRAFPFYLLIRMIEIEARGLSECTSDHVKEFLYQRFRSDDPKFLKTSYYSHKLVRDNEAAKRVEVIRKIVLVQHLDLSFTETSLMEVLSCLTKFGPYTSWNEFEQRGIRELKTALPTKPHRKLSIDEKYSIKTAAKEVADELFRSRLLSNSDVIDVSRDYLIRLASRDDADKIEYYENCFRDPFVKQKNGYKKLQLLKNTNATYVCETWDKVLGSISLLPVTPDAYNSLIIGTLEVPDLESDDIYSEAEAMNAIHLLLIPGRNGYGGNFVLDKFGASLHKIIKRLLGKTQEEVNANVCCQVHIACEHFLKAYDFKQIRRFESKINRSVFETGLEITPSLNSVATINLDFLIKRVYYIGQTE